MVVVRRAGSDAHSHPPPPQSAKPMTPTRLLLFAAVVLCLIVVQIRLLSSSNPSGPDVVIGGPPPPPTTRTRPRDESVVIGRRVVPPDGDGATFTPGEFLAGRPGGYVNLPNRPLDPNRDDVVARLTGADVPPPAERLMRLAPAPPGRDAIFGLASYPTFMTGWVRLVGSLRRAGYDGHVILGVDPNIPEAERDYLDRMGVTYYAIDVADCIPAILEGGGGASSSSSAPSGGGNAVRARCSAGLEDMKLEWGRYEMARRWLRACESCDGWSMVIDTRDVFFQSHPFASLGDPGSAIHDLLFVEEVADHTSPMFPDSRHRATNLGRSARYLAHTVPCYGEGEVRARDLVDRPMLCSGTVLGTRDGMHRFLSVLVDEFRRNNDKGRSECRSPSTTDQWTMNHLYYRGMFGGLGRTRTMPWGTGPVLTMGTPCVNSALGESRKRTSQRDMMTFDPATGLILNPHERDGSAVRVAPVLHQYDRCHNWIVPWFKEHASLFGTADGPEDEPAVAWVRATTDVGSGR